MVAQGARPGPADRNPVGKNNSYGFQSLAPHAATQRWSYTVPAAKRYQLSSLVCTLLRDSLAGTGGIAQTYIMYTPSGGAQGFLLAAVIDTNTVGAEQGLAVAASMVMTVGDLIAGFTTDASTTGTVLYGVSQAGTEYDS